MDEITFFGFSPENLHGWSFGGLRSGVSFLCKYR